MGTWILIAVLSGICVVYSVKTVKLFRSSAGDESAKEMSKKEKIISGVLLIIVNALGIAYLFGLNQDQIKAGVKEAKANLKKALDKFFDDM